MDPLTIGALARRAGVGVETVRFYERRGLVRRPARPRAGYRSYPQEDVARIRFIRNAQTLGLRAALRYVRAPPRRRRT